MATADDAPPHSCTPSHLLHPLQVSPTAGMVLAGEHEVVKLRVCAGIPERLLETLQVELAHFDPINVQVGTAGSRRAVG